MRSLGLLLVMAPVLSACGVVNAVNRFQDTQEYRETAQQYKACVLANRAAPQNCESLRLAMDADERRARGETAQSQNLNVNIR